MRLSKPRITPLQDSELDAEQVERLSKSRGKDWIRTEHFPHAGARAGRLPRVFVVGRIRDVAQLSGRARPGDRDPAGRLALQVRL